ncbi:MAG TPA: non-ribosomal peptide synthetase, partial [Acidobacteria bacterium]|nr:non-ribosomal peptide synthetase [Acidobacteriota bacterium]
MSENLQEKKARLRNLLGKSAEAVSVPPVVPRRRREDAPEPLSFAQQGLWFVAKLEGPNPAYNIPILVRWAGRLDVAALGRAFAVLIDRHDSLRTRLVELDGIPGQVLTGVPDLGLEPREVSGAEAEEACRAEAQHPFDLFDEGLLRVRLFTESQERHVLVVAMHHAISDAWSAGVLLREMLALYEAFSAGTEPALEPPPVTYVDFVHWERAWLGGGQLERQLAWWKGWLADLPPLLELPVDRPRPALQSNRGGTVHFAVPPVLVERLKELSNEQKCSLFVTLESVFCVLLHRYASQPDLAIGSGVANRRRPELEGVIGFFVNTLVLRSRVERTDPFLSVLKASRDVLLKALENQDAPFHRVVEELRPERSAGHSPLFQVMLTFQNVPYARRTVLSSAVVEAEVPDSGSAKFDLSVALQEDPGGLNGQIEYRADLFDAATVERIAAHYVRLLDEVGQSPGRPVGSYEFLTASERDALLGAWSGGGRTGTLGKSIQAVFEERVRQRPDAVALVDGDLSLTYRELSARADRLAQYLVGRGLGEAALVGVYMERCPEMVVGFLAVLKAGGAYLPLDPRNPAARTRRLLAGAAVEVVLTSPALRAAVPAEAAETVLVAEALAAPGPLAGADLAAREDGDRSLAYVMYTSGSTGEPKGVAIEHRGVTRLVCGADWVDLGEDTVALQHSALSFDASTLEIWAPLLNGGRLVLCSGDAADVEGLAGQVERHRVNLLWLSAGVLPLWVEQHAKRDFALRHLLAGGDVVPEKCVREIYGLDPDVLILNGYGPTENTTFSCCHPIPREGGDAGSLPIGRPIRGSSAYVLDESLQLLPVGCAGELYVGGAGLARGYLNRPDLTEERFVGNPFSQEPGERLYRTGDKVRRRPDGILEFLGRTDNQVKIRGFRIELEEIEQQLSGLPDVDLAAVVAREDRPGEKRLVAYVAMREGRPAEPGRLRDGLAAKLPEYMVPAVFVALPALPLTPNGKVDRRALPAPEGEAMARGGYVAPRTELERRLCEIWEEVLGVERIGIEDGFFELGGHSLLAARVLSRVRAALGIEVPLRTMFEHPSVGAWCERLPELGGGLALPEIEVLASRERLPLSYAQQRLWFVDRLEGGSSHYNIPETVRVTGRLDTRAFARALQTIVERHESLRTVFREADGEVIQVIGDGAAFHLEEKDLSGLAAEERAREVRRLALEDAQRPFDLGNDLLLRVALLRLSETEHVALLNMHHIASDGWSMDVLLRELGTLYEAFRAGRENPLPPLRVQYADYAHWQRQWLRGEVLEEQLGYWRRRLADLPLVHSLPLDNPRPAQQTFAGGQHVRRLTGELRERIGALARASAATPFMVLQASLAVLVHRFGGETDVVMGSPVAGRVHRDVEPLIGFFVNTLVLRSDLTDNPRFLDLLAACRQTVLDAYAHQHAPLEMLVQELRPERSLSHSPLFQILLAWQAAGRPVGELADARLDWAGESSGIVKFDLELHGLPDETGATLNWLYKKELFDEGTIARWASSFGVLLDGVLESPGQRVGSAPLLTPAERRELLASWDGGGYPREASIPGLFEAQAARDPEAAAVVSGALRLTYGELNERSNRLAHLLIERGIAAETAVGLCLDRSPEMLVGVLAILKAGAAYVPLDPDYPEVRLAAMLESGGVRAVLTASRLAGLGCLAGRDVLALDDPELAARLAQQPAWNPGRPVDACQLAYVIFTSGSTGEPKGVMVEHRSVVRLVVGARFVPLDAGTVMLQLSSVSFDAATLEIWGPLLNGGRLVLYPERVPEAGLLNEQIERHGINTLWLTAGLFEQWSYQLPRAGELRWVLTGGDVVDPSAVARACAGLAGLEVIDGYGPTENTTFTTCHAIPRGFDPRRPVPLGRPIGGTGVFLLQGEGELAPLGGIGEIHAAGDGLARGYRGRPDLTAERFVPDPHAVEPGARLYRTGDLGRWRLDGTLEFLGRLDTQVKIRGFRVEPGEIEAQLRSLPAVREAVVLARGDGAGGKRLVAWVVPATQEAEAAVLAVELRDALRRRVPDYMVPWAFVVLPQLPLTKNGKVDRRALPAPQEGGRPGGERVAPRTELERRLCEIWEELLG